MKTCKTPDCSGTDFYSRNAACKQCSKKLSLERYHSNGGYQPTEEQRNRSNRLTKDRQHAMRRDPDKRALIIWYDSRKSDRKFGRENDLTVEVIDSHIKKPCSYCGEENLKKTLDRVDNSLGHTQSNVVTACIRCNYIRRNMPYEAWLCLALGLTKARESGLFLNWTGEVSKLGS